MELAVAEKMAREAMESHGLIGWRFEFDRATRRFGKCNHGRRVIGLSAPLVRINDPERVRLTILHEVAHALAGYDAGHGAKWQRICVEIGGDGQRCYTPENTVTPVTKWTGTCPACGQEFHRERLSASLKRQGGWCPCTKTGDPATAIRWRENR